MATHEVWLRCSPLSSKQQIESAAEGQPADHDDSFEGKKGGMPVLAHWQLECNDKIYEIGRKGAIWNPFNPLEFLVSRAQDMEGDKSVFYRKRIGMTSKSAKDIRKTGKRIVEGGNYHLFLRNCQTTVKNLAEAIIDKSNMDPAFDWPWRAVHACMIVVAAAATIGTAYVLWPVQGVIQVAGANNILLTCSADWSMCGKFVAALRNYWSNGTALHLRWRVGDKLLHSMPLSELVGQWSRAKLLPLIKCGVGMGAVFLTAIMNPEWLEHLKEASDKLVNQAKLAWNNFMELLETLLSKYAKESNTVLLDGVRSQVLV